MEVFVFVARFVAFVAHNDLSITYTWIRGPWVRGPAGRTGFETI